MCCELFLSGAFTTTYTLSKMKYHRLWLFLFVRGWTVISLVIGLGVKDQQNGLYVISFYRVK